MAKRGRYSNETKEQAELFINMMDGNVGDAFGVAFGRAEMFWDEADSGERDVEDAVKATTLTNYLAYMGKKSKRGE